jgi:large subunit ribosomal protein L24
MSLKIKKGDLVMVSAAHAYSANGDSMVAKNQTGRVLAVYPRKGTAIVEGLNLFKKHMKPRSQQQPGGIVEREMPLALSKLMLCEPGGKKRPARFATRTDEKGNKLRVLKLAGEGKEVTV